MEYRQILNELCIDTCNYKKYPKQKYNLFFSGGCSLPHVSQRLNQQMPPLGLRPAVHRNPLLIVINVQHTLHSSH